MDLMPSKISASLKKDKVNTIRSRLRHATLSFVVFEIVSLATSTWKQKNAVKVFHTLCSNFSTLILTIKCNTPAVYASSNLSWISTRHNKLGFRSCIIWKCSGLFDLGLFDRVDSIIRAELNRGPASTCIIAQQESLLKLCVLSKSFVRNLYL